MTTTIEQVLDHLNGWEIEDSSDTEQEEAVYVIKEEEVTKFITKAKIRVAGYLKITDISKIPDNALVDEAVATWAAGLLWNKKIHKSSEGKEEDDPTTYGDKKISEAKALLNAVDLDPDNDGISGVEIGIFTINKDTYKEN